MNNRRYFVTGTDTSVGKTLISVALLELAGESGLRAIGIKPVAAGCEPGEHGLVNADALKLQQASSVKADYAQVNPVALKPPIAPHIAANEAGIELQAAVLARHCLNQGPADLTIIEGAGGWLVPLNDRETLADVCTEINAHVILVVGMKLGCINHALLTAAAIRSAGVQMAGWVGNCTSAAMPALEQNLATLRQRLGAPCLGVVPFLDPCTSKSAADHLSLKALMAADA